jgi:hypothetical protein
LVPFVAVCYPLHYDEAVSVEVLDCLFISAGMLRRQMKWRNVSATETIAVLEQPDHEEKSTSNRINAYRLLNDRFLKVTYKREGSDVMVVTVIEKER